MVQLKRSEIRLVEDFVAYPRGRGYVVDLSDNTFADFFEDECGIDIYSQYRSEDDSKKSKRQCLVAFCEAEHPVLVARALRRLHEMREAYIVKVGAERPDNLNDSFLALVASIESGADQPRTDALERYIADRTLDELVRDLERTIAANKPEAALDHLHTYCVKKMRHLLGAHSVSWDDGEALQSLFGKYRKALLATQQIHEFSGGAMKAAISVFEKFNDVRNKRSLAHDNEILAHAEARYVFDVVCAMLRFVRALEAGRFEELKRAES